MGRVEEHGVERWGPRVLYFALGVLCAAWADHCSTADLRERFNGLLGACNTEAEGSRAEMKHLTQVIDDCHDLLRACEMEERHRSGALAECNLQLISSLSAPACQ